MSVAEMVLERLNTLPDEKQLEVLQFVEFLASPQKKASELPRRNRPPSSHRIRGMWAEYGFHITDEDIAQARKEMWGNFPREF